MLFSSCQQVKCRTAKFGLRNGKETLVCSRPFRFNSQWPYDAAGIHVHTVSVFHTLKSYKNTRSCVKEYVVSEGVWSMLFFLLVLH